MAAGRRQRLTRAGSRSRLATATAGEVRSARNADVPPTTAGSTRPATTACHTTGRTPSPWANNAEAMTTIA